MKRIDFLKKNLPPSGKVLDIGNLDKKGKLHKELQAQYPTLEFWGLDIVSQEEVGTTFPHQLLGSFEAIPVEDAQFDVIYAGQVLEHTWTPKVVMDEFYRVLKPGGRLILDFPNVYSFSRMARYFLTGKDVILGNDDHKIFYSKAMVDNLGKKSGFEVSELVTETCVAVSGKLFWFPDIYPFNHVGETLCVSLKK